MNKKLCSYVVLFCLVFHEIKLESSYGYKITQDEWQLWREWNHPTVQFLLGTIKGLLKNL
jgi:hypothetical protein